MREVPSIPVGLEPKLRNVLSAVRESLNAAITNINANSEGLNGIRQWIMPAIEANNDLTIFSQAQINAALESATGATGAGGDSVDIVFVRAASQPATPTASSGTPTAPITWYTDVASVPVSANPLWASTGFKASASANYTWDTPVRVEGASVAEVTVFTRGVPTSTPTGGTYTFSNPPVLAVPTSTGATWYTSIPSGTTAVYTSRAVVSTAAGNTSAVAITGWTTHVISLQNGADGPTGPTGARANFTTYAATGTLWTSGATYIAGQQIYYGLNWYTATAGTSGTVAPIHVSGTVTATGGTATFAYAKPPTWTANVDTVANTAITSMVGSGGVIIVGDEVTICWPNTTSPTYVLTKYASAVGSPATTATWTARGQVIDGNLMVTGTLSAASLKTSNLTAANAITVVNASNTPRVKMGNLGSSYGLQGWDNSTRSVFQLDENGLDAKITQSALHLFGGSYHSQIVLEGDYTFSIYGASAQNVVIPIPISTLGMYQLFARVTGYWENDLFGTASYASHALWREMSMGAYYQNKYTTAGGGNDISKVLSMGEVRQGDDTTDATDFPYTKIKLQVNSVTAANLIVGTDYTITTVGTTNWNTVSGGDLTTPYAIGDSFRTAVAGGGTGIATTGNPQLSLSSRIGNSTATNTTTFSYTVLAVDNKMYPFEVF